MKTKIITLIAIIGIIIIASCKKNNPGPGSSGLSGATGLLKRTVLVETANGQTDSVVTTFGYDGQNRLTEQIALTYYSGIIGVVDTNIYTFTNGTVVDNGSRGYHVIYYLNGMGYKASDNLNLGDSWSYNANGYLDTIATPGSIVFYTYNDSNELVSDYNLSSGITTYDTYVYPYPAKPTTVAPSSNWISGSAPTTLYSADVQVRNTDTTIFSYAYVLNAQNRLTQQTVTSPGVTTVVTYYSYY